MTNNTPAVTEKPVKKAKPKKSFDEEVRETVEAVVIAFILAFLFRTSVAEAFIIPTGSMATTLFGRHKDLTCPGCGYEYEMGASYEIDDAGYLNPGNRIDMSICPNCQHVNRDVEEKIGFKGDRILVNKAAYQYMTPKRYDVIVFKYPMDPKTNYIKRLVGLPGETIMIRRGNLYLKNEQGFQILRRPEHKQQIQELVVYDDRYPETPLIDKGWPQRWLGMSKSSNPNPLDSFAGWNDVPDLWKRQHGPGITTYSIKLEHAQANPDAWLRYRHILPDPADWDHAEANRNLRPTPRLITDICGYNNEFVTNNPLHTIDRLESGMFWISDLTLECEATFSDTKPDGRCTFELNRGVHHFQFSFELATGELTLSQINTQNSLDDRRILGKFKTPVKGNGSYNIKLANVDDQLTIWIDGQPIDTQGKGQYTLLETDDHAPTLADFTPIGINLKNSAGVIKNLVINRDVYYQGHHIAEDYNYATYIRDLYSRVNDPVRWYQAYSAKMDQHDSMTLTIGPTDYFVLGDNSPCSADGRLWEGRQTVPQNALVGKAFFIYWPHGVPFGGENNQGFTLYKYKYRSVNESGQDVIVNSNYPSFSAPFYPDFKRMKWIR